MKIWKIALLVGALVFGALTNAPIVNAENNFVIESNKDGLFYSEADSEFMVVENMQPGEVITEHITIINNHHHSYTLSMQPIAAHEDHRAIMEILKIKIIHNTDVVYEGMVDVLHDICGVINLGVFDPGTTTTLTAQVEMKIHDSGDSNSWKNLKGQFDWVFRGLRLEEEIKPGSINVLKIDSKTDLPLANAEFQLYDENKELVSDLVVKTDEKGFASFEGIVPGTYYLKEIKAPNGYILPEYEIKIVYNGDEQVTTVLNTKKATDPNTGDSNQLGNYTVLLLGSCALILWLFVNRKKTNK